MTSRSTPKDKFYEKVINPYLADVLQHPQTIEMREGVLHIRDVEGPRNTGSAETKIEAMEQQVFKFQGMVERGPKPMKTPSCLKKKLKDGMIKEYKSVSSM